MREKGLFFLASCLLCLAGWSCSLPTRAPLAVSTAIPGGFAGEEGGEAAPPLARWWEEFNDDALNAVVEEAVSSSLELATAYERLHRSRAAVRRAGAALQPVVTAGGQVSESRQPGVNGSHTGTNYRLSLEAAYEIDVWEKLASREKSALFEERAARTDIETVYLGLAAQAVELYYLAVEQRAQLRLVDETVRSFEDTLARVEDRYRNGLVPPLDLYQARQNLSQARARRPRFETALARAEHALAVLLGRYPSRNSLGDMTLLPPAPEQWPHGLPSDVIAARPDIRAAMARLEAADAQAAAAVAERFPSFNLMAGFGQARTSLVNGDATGIFWSFLGGLVQPLWDGHRREAEIERTSSLVRERVALYHQSSLQAFREVEDALAANAATEKRLVLLARRVEAAGNSLRLSEDRYLQGLSSYLPVLTAQILHFDAQSQLLAERRQIISDRVSLARALGGSWMVVEVEKRAGSTRGREDSYTNLKP